MYQQQLANQQLYGQSKYHMSLIHFIINSLIISLDVGVPQVGSEGFSNYSPMAWSGHATPRSRNATNLHDDEFVHYSKLLKSALKYISPFFHIQFSQGNLIIIHERSTFVTIRGVSTSLHLKNIYYLIKVMKNKPLRWKEYIKEFGIPTLVEATTTGCTPPTINDDFDVNEYDPNNFRF